MRNIAMKVWILALLGLVAAVILLTGTVISPKGTQAATPGGAVTPLLSCPNVDASADNKVLVGDILPVVAAYFKDWPANNYYYLYDLTAPYNPSAPAGTGLQRVDDIIAVVNEYFTVCPLVDTQIAAASKWGIDVDGNPGNGNQPLPIMENEAALEALHYYQGSNDVPGQGVHYVNVDNWDGTFNPAAPEGLVYQNGRLAAQLYVTDGTAVGWGTHAAGPCSPCPGAEHGIELETAIDGPQCNPACSWDGPEGWHLHHYLCTVHIGTSSALAIPGAFAPSISDTQAHCASFAGEPECTVPVTTQPCYRWGKDVGWMGHLWNWLPNANQVADIGGNNGRFADCFPDAEGWKAYDCPG